MSNKRETRTWEETKEFYGNSVKEIKAEFQSLGLKFLGSNPIYDSKVKVGKNMATCSYTFPLRISIFFFNYRVLTFLHLFLRFLLEFRIILEDIDFQTFYQKKYFF